MRAPPSRPPHLPKAPPPNTMSSGVRISTYESGGTTPSAHCVTPFASLARPGCSTARPEAEVWLTWEKGKGSKSSSSAVPAGPAALSLAVPCPPAPGLGQAPLLSAGAQHCPELSLGPKVRRPHLLIDGLGKRTSETSVRLRHVQIPLPPLTPAPPRASPNQQRQLPHPRYRGKKPWRPPHTPSNS